MCLATISLPITRCVYARRLRFASSDPICLPPRQQATPEDSPRLETPATRESIARAFRDLANPAEAVAFADELRAQVMGASPKSFECVQCVASSVSTEFQQQQCWCLCWQATPPATMGSRARFVYDPC